VKNTEFVKNANRWFKMTRFLEKYQKEVVPAMQKKFNITNSMAVSKVEKVVLNMGIGDIANDKNAREKAVNTFARITGQKPSLQQAKKAIADFKIRKGDVVGLKTTLRKKRMYEFMDKLFTIVLPRVRDFSGVSKKAFDKQANYTLGLQEHIIFPEVDYDKIDKVRGLEITFVISGRDRKKSLELLKLLGMPFEKTRDLKNKEG
jgi:large subunit ribosomal protein L5